MVDATAHLSDIDAVPRIATDSPTVIFPEILAVPAAEREEEILIRDRMLTEPPQVENPLEESEPQMPDEELESIPDMKTGPLTDCPSFASIFEWIDRESPRRELEDTDKELEPLILPPTLIEELMKARPKTEQELPD